MNKNFLKICNQHADSYDFFIHCILIFFSYILIQWLYWEGLKTLWFLINLQKVALLPEIAVPHITRQAESTQSNIQLEEKGCTHQGRSKYHERYNKRLRAERLVNKAAIVSFTR